MQPPANMTRHHWHSLFRCALKHALQSAPVIKPLRWAPSRRTDNLRGLADSVRSCLQSTDAGQSQLPEATILTVKSRCSRRLIESGGAGGRTAVGSE